MARRNGRAGRGPDLVRTVAFLTASVALVAIRSRAGRGVRLPEFGGAAAAERGLTTTARPSRGTAMPSDPHTPPSSPVTAGPFSPERRAQILAEARRHLAAIGLVPDPEPPGSVERYGGRIDRNHLNADKIASAITYALGKTLAQVFVVERPHREFQLILAFSDGTSYEFYGGGWLSGARDVDDRTGPTIRAALERDGVPFLEIGGAR